MHLDVVKQFINARCASIMKMNLSISTKLSNALQINLTYNFKRKHVIYRIKKKMQKLALGRIFDFPLFVEFKCVK